MECSCVIEAQAIPRSITWRRRRTELVELPVAERGATGQPSHPIPVDPHSTKEKGRPLRHGFNNCRNPRNKHQISKSE
ncbi:essential meiotic endonuclease 1 homolog 1 (S. pombe), isoform CRA_b [Mus musculus]|nr:essential meiotic endonuclease 1 homolog 1 (S. pombe), isoform CRA_b [Mus musculus]